MRIGKLIIKFGTILGITGRGSVNPFSNWGPFLGTTGADQYINFHIWDLSRTYWMQISKLNLSFGTPPETTGCVSVT